MFKEPASGIAQAVLLIAADTAAQLSRHPGNSTTYTERDRGLHVLEPLISL